MAEFVHQTLEENIIPELDQMIQQGLFSVNETKVILKKRESLEYRLRQLTKTKASFLNYIEYERKLLELLKIRRKKCANDSKKREIEKSIADRIHQLYRLACTRFKEDISLWSGHILFSKALREKAYVSRLYDQALKIHGHKEDVWVQAARWERSQDGNNNPQLARETLLKAHRVNPESELILLEMFTMELDLAQQVLKRKSILGIRNTEGSTEDQIEDEEEESDDFKLAQIVYKKGIELLPGNAEFHLKLLSVCSKCSEARSLLSIICEDLRQLYPGDASVWEGLAWVHLTSLDTVDHEEAQAAMWRFLQVFEAAIQHLNTEAMLSACLRSHLFLLDTNVALTLRETVLRSTLWHVQQGINKQILSEEMYLGIISVLVDLGLSDDVATVVEWSTNHHPSSAPLWRARLQSLGGEAEALTATLHTALAQVDEAQTWPLWQQALTTLAASASIPELESLTDQACRWSDPAVACKAKEWTLSWAVRCGAIKQARSVYKRWKSTRPISMDFYKIALRAELAQPKPDKERIRAVLEEALMEFGRSEPDLWLNYMDFESSVAGEPERSGVIEQRALNGLEPHLKEAFIRKNIMMKLKK